MRSLWLAFMATSRWVQWWVQGLVVGGIATLGYYTVLQPERAAVERLRQSLLHSNESHAALVRRLDDLPALATLQQQWDTLPDKPVHHATVTLTERLLLPLSASNAALTLIQHITASEQPLHIHSLSIDVQHDVLHLEMQLAVPNPGEEVQR